MGCLKHNWRTRLKSGGRISFATWPPELFVGRQIALMMRYMPAPPSGAAMPASPVLWGDPNVVRERFGTAVRDLVFERDTMLVPSLSPQLTRTMQEATVAPLAKLVETLQNNPAKLAQLRDEYEALIRETSDGNCIQQHFLMSRATKV